MPSLEEPLPAPHGRRAVAWVADLAVVSLVTLLFTALVRLPELFMHPLGQSQTDFQVPDRYIWWFAAAYLVVYHTTCIWLTQCTAGKAMLGLRVRQAENRTGFGWALARTSAGYAVTDVFGAGMVVALFNTRHRCLHDLTFGTEVILERPEPVRTRALWSGLLAFEDERKKAAEEKTSSLKTFKGFVKFAIELAFPLGWLIKKLFRNAEATPLPPAPVPLAPVISLSAQAAVAIAAATTAVTAAVVAISPVQDVLQRIFSSPPSPEAPPHPPVAGTHHSEPGPYGSEPTAARYSLSVAARGPGSVTSDPAGIACAHTCSARFADGAAVVLTATAEQGSVFSGWHGACSGTAPCTVAMRGDQSVAARFEAAPTRSLVVSHSGTGTGIVASNPSGIACGTTCSASFAHAAAVVLTAKADPGSSFASWSGAGCSGTAPCTVAMRGDQSVAARFEKAPTRSLVVSRSGTGTGAVTTSPSGIVCGATCSASFADGTTVMLTATAEQGSVFSGWHGACSGTAPCTVAMRGDQSVAAGFEKASAPTRNLAVSRSGTGTGVITSNPSGIVCGTACSTSLADGTTVMLTATAYSGSSFAGWSGGGCAGTDSCNLDMSADRAVTAVFDPSPVVVGDAVVDARADIFAAGRASVPAFTGGGGMLPPHLTFPAGPGKVLTFSSVTGDVAWGVGSPHAAPEGSPRPRMNIRSYEGVAGIIDSQSLMYLVGVFLDDQEPADPAPSRLDFSPGALGHDFEVLQPQLNQVFFIGDSLTGTGKTQKFVVPANATRLFLGFGDALNFGSDVPEGRDPGWYDDNTGHFDIVCEIR